MPQPEPRKVYPRPAADLLMFRDAEALVEIGSRTSQLEGLHQLVGDPAKHEAWIYFLKTRSAGDVDDASNKAFLSDWRAR
jgi:hypothetical protein